MILWMMEEYLVYESIALIIIGSLFYVRCTNRRKGDRKAIHCSEC